MLYCCSYYDYVCSDKDKIVVNTTSRSDTWSRGLSPFYIKDIKLYSYYRATCVESAYQHSKVYKHLGHIDENGDPTPEYFLWAMKGWNSKGDRYPVGKGIKPEYLYWNGHKYGYIEARRKIYAKLYGDNVVKTEAFAKLEELYHQSIEEKFDIYLRDFDTYNFHEQGKSFNDCLNDPNKHMGHAFVLYYLLLKRSNFKYQKL